MAPIIEAQVSAKPETPQAWMSYLARKLTNETRLSDVYARYYDVEPRELSYAQEKFAEQFGKLFVGWQDNFCALIVDSVSERLEIKGFRMGENDPADKEANAIWQRNFLDADSNAAHIDSLVRGASYIVVWGDEDDEPTVTPEPASQVTVQYAAGSRRRLEAGFKRYFDDWGTEFATLWLPDRVYTAQMGPYKSWEVNDHAAANPFGFVPISPLSNRSRLLMGNETRSSETRRLATFSELKGILPIQDAINKVAADALVASEFAAFPQRIIAGLEEYESETEEKEAMLKAYVDRIIALYGDDVKWGQFDAADLGNYVKLIDMLVQHMASISRVPFHYFLLNGGQAPSGESITAAEAGLVAKARERMLHFGESWETAMRMAFAVKGSPKAEAFDAEVIWSDPEHRSKAALADALLKIKDIGVPSKQLQEEYGFTPTQIERFEAMREEELTEEVEKQRKLSAVTGALGGSAFAGNGTRADQAPKSPQVERQKAQARAA